MTVRITIEGLQRAQQANEKMIVTLRPSGAFGRAILFATTEAHRRAVYNTPWDTGGLRASHRMEMDGLRGRVFIDPAAVNPRQGGRKPAVYGYYLHQQGMRPGLRGGIRAFYKYTVERDGKKIAERAIKLIRGALP